MRLLTSRLAFARRGNRRIRRVHADAADDASELRVNVRRGPVASARRDRRETNARRRRELHVRGVNRRRILAAVGEERFFSGDEVTKIRDHRGLVRLALRVRELRNRDRGQNADDHDDDEQFDEGKALSEFQHFGGSREERELGDSAAGGEHGTAEGNACAQPARAI